MTEKLDEKGGVDGPDLLQPPEVGEEAPVETGWRGAWRTVKIRSAKYRWPLAAAGVSVILIWWILRDLGFSGVWPGILVGAFSIPLFWIATKPHYLKIVQLEYDTERKAIYFGLWQIPHPLANEVRINGPRGWVYGPDNEMMHVVSSFDDIKLKGKAHYHDNWTTARVIADINADRVLIAQNQKIIERYAAANAIAEANAIQFWVAAAVEKSFQLGLIDKSVRDAVKDKREKHYKESEQSTDKRK